MTTIYVAIETLEQAEALQGTGAKLKVGLPIITEYGEAILGRLDERGFTAVLWDAKFFDIPSVVHKATRELAGWHILEGITVHIRGGQDMMVAARQAAGDVPIYGVTQLTSDPNACLAGVLGLASGANVAGLYGVISPYFAIKTIRELHPHLAVLCPGIRPMDCNVGDQKWTATPTAAAQAGADAIIIGRPITEAADPAAAYLDLVREVGP